ncbi:MAG: hybrid sensor histidine kinase/response regulator, partial [Nitrospira sp.]|nr:hybrid sensor histidine kinase/response regulator [Nitrospira sp.]
MKQPLRILYLEDDITDVELIKSTLLDGGVDYNLVHVATETDFINAIKKETFD